MQKDRRLRSHLVPLLPANKSTDHEWKPILNIDTLWTLIPAENREKYLKGETDTVPVIDLLSFGYAKLLGKGRLPQKPIVVKARYVSKEAEKKITEAGGVVELVA
jgi:large subunit ribosomal protein L27Ae